MLSLFALIAKDFKLRPITVWRMFPGVRGRAILESVG